MSVSRETEFLEAVDQAVRDLDRTEYPRNNKLVATAGGTVYLSSQPKGWGDGNTLVYVLSLDSVLLSGDLRGQGIMVKMIKRVLDYVKDPKTNQQHFTHVYINNITAAPWILNLMGHGPATSTLPDLPSWQWFGPSPSCPSVRWPSVEYGDTLSTKDVRTAAETHAIRQRESYKSYKSFIGVVPNPE